MAALGQFLRIHEERDTEVALRSLSSGTCRHRGVRMCNRARRRSSARRASLSSFARLSVGDGSERSKRPQPQVHAVPEYERRSLALVSVRECIASALSRSHGSPGARRARLHAGKCVRLKLVGRVAQVVEQRPFKAWVAGSIPAALTKILRNGRHPRRRASVVFASASLPSPDWKLPRPAILAM